MNPLLPLRAPAARARRTRGRHSAGYTAVEVLTAMTLFAIGAAGVVGMQRTTIQGGTDARRFDQATNIAREWESRLQRDGMFWTEPNAEVLTSNLSTTRWLAATPTGTTWVTPATTGLGLSGAFDILGRDVPSNDAETFFCVQYRLNWIADPGTPPKPTGIIRAEVRVFWSRLELGPARCNAPNPSPDVAAADNAYHFVYLTTAVRGNPSR